MTTFTDLTAELYTKMCHIMARHAKRGDETLDHVVSRAFRKNIRAKFGYDVRLRPIGRKNMTIVEEEWATDRLKPLLVRGYSAPKRARLKPRFLDVPLVVAKFKGREFLIDGNRRALGRIYLEKATTTVLVATIVL